MFDIFSLQKKTVLLTGACGGLGTAFAHTLAKAGANVVLLGRHQDRLARLAEDLAPYKRAVSYFVCDFNELHTIDPTIDAVFQRAGTIDVLINNAGATSRTKKEAFQYTENEWDEIFNLNVKALWMTTNAVVRRLIEAKQTGGSVINIASTNAARPRPTNTLYCISKSAVVSVTENLAMDYAPYHIRVNAIAPGIFGVGMSQDVAQNPAKKHIISSMTPLKRMGSVDELMGPLLLLASDASSYMTGQCLYVDGGIHIGVLQ